MRSHSRAATVRPGGAARRGVRLSLTTIVACVAVVATFAGTASASPQVPLRQRSAATAPTYRLDPEILVQWHGMWSYYTDEQREQVLTTLQQANIHLLRMDVAWPMLQPVNGSTYDAWGVSFLDRVIDMMNAHGMSPQITLWLTPGWANDNQGERVLPSNVADYARVAQWAAHRYGNKVEAWEVWNEPNSDNFLFGADPVAYTRLLQAAYPAFKAGDPATTVVFGGTQYNDAPWIARCYAAGVKGYFDVMATHSYQAPSNESPLTPDDGTIWKFTHVVAVHNLMVAQGDGGKSIWTGMGYSTHVDPPDTPNWRRGVTEATQALYYKQAVSLIRRQWPWIGKFGVYVARDEDVSADFHERHFGLLRADLSPKPALATLRLLTRPPPASP